MRALEHILDQRREELGISQARLAELAGVSLPTIKRFLSSKNANVSYETVCAVAKVLGMKLVPEQETTPQELLKKKAYEKAHWLSSVVMGTSALEAQGLDPKDAKTIEETLFYKLMSGPRSRIWNA